MVLFSSAFEGKMSVLEESSSSKFIQFSSSVREMR